MKLKKCNRLLNVGEVFSSWTVVEEIRRENQSARHYLCRCLCGTEQVINASTLKYGHSTKCRKCAFHKHSLSRSAAYKIWGGMHSRCYNPKVKIYQYYGGRGIKVCDRWHDFSSFYSDMGDRPAGLQLDRIDNNKDYCPENCKWVTPKENNPYNKGQIHDSMPGKRFGRWTILNRVIHKPGHLYYLCRCDCGIEAVRAGGELRSGKTTRCRSCKNRAHSAIHIGWSERKKNAAQFA